MLGNYVWIATIVMIALAAFIFPIEAWRRRRPPK